MAWLQNPIKLPYFGEGENIIPTIHIKDLTKIIKQIIEKKPEQRYLFALDKTIDKRSKAIISSISRGIGSGLTNSCLLEDYTVSNMKFNSDDLYLDPKFSEKTKLELLYTDAELAWPNFIDNKLDIFLSDSKFIEEEFEWHCKEGIAGNIKKLLDEFCQYRNLRPLKIIINGDDIEERKAYAEMISLAYNIPVINDIKLREMLELEADKLDEEETYMKKLYLELIDIQNGKVDLDDIV